MSWNSGRSQVRRGLWGLTGRAGPRPRYAWTGGSKQRGVRYDSVLDSERHVAPREASGLRHFGISRRHEQVEMVGRHDLPLGKTGNVDDTAEPEIRVTFQVVDEILAREVFFGCRSLDHILVTEVAVHVDLRGHYRLAGQI